MEDKCCTLPQKSWLHIQLEAEAHRIADRVGARSYAEYQHILHAVAHEQFLQAIRPLQEIKGRALATVAMRRRWLVTADGFQLQEIQLPPEIAELFKSVNQLIAIEAERYGVTQT